MKNLYIDFDGVIMNTIEVTYKDLNDLNLDSKKIEHQEKIREYYIGIDWHELINKRASIINDAMGSIKKILASNKFNVSILTHVFSLDEAVEKIDYIKKYFGDISSFLPNASYFARSRVAISPSELSEYLTSSLPENSIITWPAGAGEIKESCFSAVVPVKGWNQWV